MCVIKECYANVPKIFHRPSEAFCAHSSDTRFIFDSSVSGIIFRCCSHYRDSLYTFICSLVPCSSQPHSEHKCHRDEHKLNTCASSPMSFPFRAPSRSQSSAGRHAGREGGQVDDGGALIPEQASVQQQKGRKEGNVQGGLFSPTYLFPPDRLT